MGCFLGCFGGEKDHKHRKHRINRGSPRAQRNRVQNVQQETKITAEQFIPETPPTDLVTELRTKPGGEEQQLQLSPSPRKRVTFNSNVKTYEHVSAQESIDSLPEFNIEKEKENLKRSQSLSEDDNSVISSVGSYPPNHRYHNARDSDDDESEVYSDSDLDDFEDDLDDDDNYDDSDEDIDVETAESVLTGSAESYGHKTSVRYRCGYVSSVLNPVENISQWKAVKSKGTLPLKPQKENLTENIEAPPPLCLSLTSEPTFRQAPKPEQLKSKNQEIAVDASLSNWLVTPEIPISKKATSNSARSIEDRPILGAWTVDELRQMSASSSPRKSTSRSPDEMPIIGTVGTYWNHSTSSFTGMHEMRK